MTTVILVSILTPIAAGALFLAARRGLPKLVVDARGIALQTIIVMVVLLAIAGAVTAVLLTTAGRTTQEAEGADVTTKIDSQAECEGTSLVGSAVGDWTATTTTCEFESTTAGIGNGGMSASECRLRGGTFTASATATGKAKCTVT